MGILPRYGSTWVLPESRLPRSSLAAAVYLGLYHGIREHATKY